MFNKLYGKIKDRENLKSVLDEVRGDLSKLASHLPSDDRQLLEEHTDMVRQFERELKKSHTDDAHPTPILEEGIIEQNDQMPKISRMQTELLVSTFRADFTRIATLQFTNSVGQASMSWLGIPEPQHTLSHKPNSDADAQEKLTKINAWYASEIAYLARRLAETPEPEEVVLCSIIQPSFGQMNSVKATRIPTKISHGPSLAAGSDSKVAEWSMLVGNHIIDYCYPLLMAWGLQTCLDSAILTSVAMDPSRDCLSYKFWYQHFLSL